MRVPPYWAKDRFEVLDRRGNPLSLRAWGWSFDSLAAAQDAAALRKQRILDRLAAGAKPDSYDYLEHPLREEIVQTIMHDGQQVAVITRNRYGSLVLNCATACFIDIDFPPITPTGFADALLLYLLGWRKAARMRAARDATIESVMTWLGGRGRRAFRLYRTAAGLRLLLADRAYDPVSDEVAGILRELGSDPMYQRLTARQECFRARLTAKPWRCGCHRPPNRYPWDTGDDERRYRDWQRTYEERAERFATCHLLDSSDTIMDEAIAAVVRAHDEYACRESKVRLA